MTLWLLWEFPRFADVKKNCNCGFKKTGCKTSFFRLLQPDFETLFVILLNMETYGVPARTERQTWTRKTGKCTEGERCGLNVCVVPSLNGQVPFNLRGRERDKREADKRELIKSITNCRLTTACTGLYTEENNKDYLTEKYEGRQ